ncbi:hypothetical protein L6R52_24210, partial [Myxococcota bacterium]|nr:hypothetical protein [Myxococcota bacterium]
MTTVRSPRPGVRFEVALARRPSALPRLDVAGFVGFAAAGPLDVPVPVEDVASFRDVFGPDVDLARDEGNEPVRSELGPAVEAFFANGGRRAWVVRVAARGPGGATRARWRVPGLYDVERRRWASVVARSEGTWAEPLGVGAREETLVLPAARDGYTLLATGELVELGDLVRARCAGGRFGWFEVTRIHGRAAELRDLDLWFETFVP